MLTSGDIKTDHPPSFVFVLIMNFELILTHFLPQLIFLGFAKTTLMHVTNSQKKVNHAGILKYSHSESSEMQ